MRRGSSSTWTLPVTAAIIIISILKGLTQGLHAHPLVTTLWIQQGQLAFTFTSLVLELRKTNAMNVHWILWPVTKTEAQRKTVMSSGYNNYWSTLDMMEFMKYQRYHLIVKESDWYSLCNEAFHEEARWDRTALNTENSQHEALSPSGLRCSSHCWGSISFLWLPQSVCQQWQLIVHSTSCSSPFRKVLSILVFQFKVNIPAGWLCVQCFPKTGGCSLGLFMVPTLSSQSDSHTDGTFLMGHSCLICAAKPRTYLSLFCFYFFKRIRFMYF